MRIQRQGPTTAIKKKTQYLRIHDSLVNNECKKFSFLRHILCFTKNNNEKKKKHRRVTHGPIGNKKNIKNKTLTQGRSECYMNRNAKNRL